MRLFDTSGVDDELHMVDAEIAKQKQMLREADGALNNLLEKMNADVQNLDHSPDNPEIESLKIFLANQREKQIEKIKNLEDENENLTIENSKMKKSLKQKNKKSNEEIEKLKNQLKKLERANKNSSKDRDQEEKTKVQLAEERVRMALEEKLNEMWQPAEVLKRIASFVDSEFRNVGNDELTSALENIRDTSREMHNRDTKKVKIDLQKANHLLANSIPKNQVPQLDSPLKHEMQKQNAELKAYKNGQKRAETELAKVKAEKRAANDEIKDLKLKLSEKDGIILDNQKEIKRQDMNNEQMQKENEAYNEKLLSLNNELTALTSDLSAKEKLGQRLRNQIDQLKRDDESKSQSRDALSNELTATRRNIADREQELQEFARKLQDEKARNNRNVDQIDQLQNAVEQLKKELKAARRQKKQDQATKDQIRQMKAMIEDMKESENASTQATRIFDNFNDRFDEVLAAINNTEKRLDFGSKNRTGRILNAIDELYNLLLDSDDRHDLHADVMNELRGLRKRLQPIQSANGDEFYYVPNGRVPTSTQGTVPIPQEVTVTDAPDATDCTDGQFTDGQNTDGTKASQKFDATLNDAEDIDAMGYLNRKQRRKKSRTKHLIEIPQPVLIGPYAGNSRKIVFIPEPVRRKKSRDHRLRYSLEITSRPEKIAKAHSESVLKTLQLI